MNIRIENGSFGYKDGPMLLKQIRLEAGEGQMIAVLGPNGVGKTTLLRCMLGLLPWKEGQTVLNGTEIKDIPKRSFWQQVSYVPQAKTAAAAYTVEEMLLLGRASHIAPFAAPAKADLMIVQDVMERLHITALRRKRCNAISGGELQMALIGRALVAGAGILVLDEPESNLDFRNQLIVLETLKELAQEGRTIIFNTHYPAHALQHADQALLLKADGSSRFGTVEEVITEDTIREAFGVHSVIRTIESERGIVRDVVPVALQEKTES